MQTDNRIMDDLARLANSALGTLQGVREEIEVMIRQRVERLVADLDLVTREDFDVVRDMAVKARGENEALEKRIASLEAAMRKKTTGGTQTAKTAKAAKKPGAKSGAKSKAKSKG